jgi:hypothetical protein
MSSSKSRRPEHHEGYPGPCRLSTALTTIRAAAARHDFQALDFLAHGFVEDCVGKEDQPLCGLTFSFNVTGIFERLEEAEVWTRSTCA